MPLTGEVKELFDKANKMEKSANRLLVIGVIVSFTVIGFPIGIILMIMAGSKAVKAKRLKEEAMMLSK